MVVYRRSCFRHTLSFTSVRFARSRIMNIAQPRAATIAVSNTMETPGYRQLTRPNHMGMRHGASHYTPLSSSWSKTVPKDEPPRHVLAWTMVRITTPSIAVYRLVYGGVGTASALPGFAWPSPCPLPEGEGK